MKICATCGKTYNNKNLYYCCKACSKVSTVVIDETKLVDLYNKGFSYNQLAERLNTNRIYIAKHINKLLADKIITKRNQKIKIDTNRLLHLYNDHFFSIQHIAKCFNVSYSTIDNRLSELKRAGAYVRNYYVQINDDELIRLYREHTGSHRKLALIYRCHRSTVWKHLKRLYEEGKLPEYGTNMYQVHCDEW